MYRTFIKPAIDFLISSLGLLILSPLLLITLILLAIANKGEPFFFQKRPGKNKKIFKIVKFKTMNDAKNCDGSLKSDAERLTPIGNFVRKTSIDEIPQLWNILKGDMSLIGPRPLLPEYLTIYNAHQQKRHLVKPGITGWAQVNGRNAISWKNKLDLDVWYVEHLTFWLDIKILFKTVKKVVLSEDINTANMATTEPFNGKN